MNIVRFGFLFLLLIAGSAAPASSQSLPEDTVAVFLRVAPDSALAAFRADQRFDYSDERGSGDSAVKRLFLRRLAEFFSRLFGSGVGRPLLWILAIAILAFAVSLLRGSSPQPAFYRRGRAFETAFTAADLQRTDFDAMISKAEAAADFREAVRLRFARALRDLSERKWIRWAREKTNRTYVLELRESGPGAPLAGKFQTSVRWFDYCWYGHVDVDQDVYARIDADFKSFESMLHSTAGEGDE